MAAQQDHGTVMEILHMRAYADAKRQAKTHAASMSQSQTDMIAEVFRWRQELDI